MNANISRFLLLFLSILLFFCSFVFSQSPGLIVRPAGGNGVTILNPNGNAYSSATTAGFTTNDITQPATTVANGSWTVWGLSLAASENYYAIVTANGCSSLASASAGVLTPTTICPTIAGTYNQSSASVDGTLPSSFTGTVRLYLDGTLIGSTTVSVATSWTIKSPFTYSFYPGGTLTCRVCKVDNYR